VLTRKQCRVRAQPRCLVGRRLVSLLSCSALESLKEHAAECGPIAISRHSTNSLGRSFTQKCLLESTIPVHVWALKKAGAVDPTGLALSWGSDKSQSTKNVAWLKLLWVFKPAGLAVYFPPLTPSAIKGSAASVRSVAD
jgi:hypothetical protein